MRPIAFRAVCLSVFLVSADPAAGQLAVSPPVLDFGDRGHHETPSDFLEIRNEGTEPLAIREVRQSCSCITLDSAAAKAPIPPGGSVKLQVHMASGRAIGKLEKHIDILPVDPRVRPVRVAARMRVFDGFSQDPLDLRFDGIVGGPPITRSFEVRRPGDAGAAAGPPFSLEAGAVKESFGASPRAVPHFTAKVVDVPGGKRVDVTLGPTHPEGRVYGNLECKLEGKLLVVPITGEVFRGIKVVPTYFNFNRVVAGDPSTLLEESVLTSTDGRPFRITGMAVKFTRRPVDDAQVAVEDVPRGGTAEAGAPEHTLRARISGGAKPPRDASFSGTVTVTTDHPEKPQVVVNFFGFFAEGKVKVSGSGSGAEPQRK
ncbi:MAG: DUF1573 domain-containing protein [Planctomycetes bacterium]|nr:DUF1573 domain-containing protein [Planctomycetota bacterium]